MRALRLIILPIASLFTGNLFVYAQAPVEIVPSRAALVFAVDDPVGLLETAESLPIDRLQDEVPAVRLAMLSPQMLAFRGGLMWAERQLGSDYHDVLKVAAGRGLVLAVENEKSIVMVTNSPEPDRLPGLVRAIAQLASGMKVGRDAPAPEPTATYRDINAFKIGELAVAVVGDSLVLATNGELAKATIDRMLDVEDEDLWKSLPEGTPSSIRILLRHEALPKIEEQIAKATGPNRDFGQELLFGGVLSALTSTGETIAVANLTNNGLSVRWKTLRGKMPYIDSDTGEVRRFNETDDVITGSDAIDAIRRSVIGGFELPPPVSSGPAITGKRASLDLPEPSASTIAEITVDRDLALLWSEKDTLLTEEAAARLEVADSQLSTAFGGFDFGDEVLGAINPTLRILVYPPSNQDAKPPVLPDAAVLGSLRVENPDEVGRRFRIAWQTVIGIVNVERGGNGLPQLELETQRDGDLKMMTGHYSVADAEELNADSVDLYASLAPTIATQKERIAIATSDDLAKRVISDESLQPKAGDGGLLTVSVNGEGIAKVLELNRPALLAQNMLNKGHTKEQAEAEVDTLIGAVGFVKALAVRAVVHPSGLWATAKIDWSEVE